MGKGFMLTNQQERSIFVLNCFCVVCLDDFLTWIDKFGSSVDNRIYSGGLINDT